MVLPLPNGNKYCNINKRNNGRIIKGTKSKGCALGEKKNWGNIKNSKNIPTTVNL